MNLRGKNKQVKLSSRFNFGTPPSSYTNAIASANSPAAAMGAIIPAQPALFNQVVSSNSVPQVPEVFSLMTELGDFLMTEASENLTTQ